MIGTNYEVPHCGIFCTPQSHLSWVQIFGKHFADDTAVIAKTQKELQDMVNRLVDTGSKYDMKINIDKSQVMRTSRSNESLQIK